MIDQAWLVRASRGHCRARLLRACNLKSRAVRHAYAVYLRFRFNGSRLLTPRITAIPHPSKSAVVFYT